MTEIGVALALLLDHLLLHALPVVAVEGVALNDRRDHAFAPEDLLESRPHGAGPGAGRAGDHDDGVFDRQGTQAPQKGARLRLRTIPGFGAPGGSGRVGLRRKSIPEQSFLNPPSRLKSLLAKATFCAHWACRLRLSCGRRCRHYRAPLGSRELARSLNRDHVGRACLQSKR